MVFYLRSRCPCVGALLSCVYRQNNDGICFVSRQVIALCLWAASILMAVFTPNINIVVKLLGSLAAIFIFVFPGELVLTWLGSHCTRWEWEPLFSHCHLLDASCREQTFCTYCSFLFYRYRIFCIFDNLLMRGPLLLRLIVYWWFRALFFHASGVTCFSFYS